MAPFFSDSWNNYCLWFIPPNPQSTCYPTLVFQGALWFPPLKSMSNPNPGFCTDRVIQSRQSQQKQLWRKNQRERALLICGIVPSFSAISWHTGHKARKLPSSDSGLACACERVYQWEVADSESKGRNNKNSGFSRHMQLCMHLVSSKSVHQMLQETMSDRPPRFPEGQPLPSGICYLSFFWGVGGTV